MIRMHLVPWQGEHGPDHQYMGLMSRIQTLRWIIVVLLGFGWDWEHPFRPWPWLSWSRSPKGHAGFCLSFFGFFTNVRWRQR